MSVLASVSGGLTMFPLLIKRPGGQDQQVRASPHLVFNIFWCINNPRTPRSDLTLAHGYTLVTCDGEPTKCSSWIPSNGRHS
jgi:hypothetical protein